MSNFMDRIARLSPEQRALLERKMVQQSAPVITSIQRQKQTELFDLSFGQQRLWFLEQFQPGNTAYNYCEAIRFNGPLDVSALERGVNEIVRRHDVLRTVFRTHNNAPIQHVQPHSPISIPVLSVRDIAEPRRVAHLRNFALEEMARAFNLETGPLLRIKLLRYDEHDHVLMLTTHHILFDGWSAGVFIRELLVLYSAFANQKRSPLPELSIQYSDFTQWQRQRLRGAVLDSELNYWKKHLANLTTLNLPLDHARPPVQTYNGKSVALNLSPELTEALRVLGRKEKSTLFMILLAGFKALLHRYSGQDDIVVGTPIAGRTQAQFEFMIGLFVNMLVVRTNTSGNPTFQELLANVRTVCLNAYQHQELPFDRLVEALQPERTPDRAPLFQVNFILQNTPRPSVDSPGLHVTLPGVPINTARFDLTLVLSENTDSLQAVMEYNTDLFDEATIQNMLGHYETLLSAAVRDPACRIDSLPLLTARERQKILVEWNDTRVEYPKEKTVHALFEAQVRRTPDAPAITFDGRTLTYSEVNARANAIAEKLRMLGVAPGILAGICVERSHEMIVGVLAILKAGGSYVPMDPHYPTDRLSHMISDTRMPVLLTQKKLAGGHPVENVKLLLLDDEQADAATSDANAAVSSEDVAYCIYTSGSTGRPKGVQITHRAVVNFLYSMQKQPGISERDVLLSVTTLSFDICGLEMFLPLMCGAHIVLVSREETVDAAAMIRRVTDSGATIMQATPSLWRMMFDAGWSGKPGLKALCGGEALPVKLAEQLLAGGIELWNMYGPTETTIWSSLKKIERADQINIGRPIANTQMYIVNAANEPVPVGVAGDLYIGGDGLARGYLNRPELNAERFVRDPFSAQPNARMYKTGDLARYLPNGEIQYLGRGDHQVKIRGHRIELGEIETALSRHPSVREVVVIAKDDPSAGKRLIAYLSPVRETLNTSELRAFLEPSLPEIMIPAAFVVLDALPLTPNGKVDRNALPEPHGAAAEPGANYVEPRNDTERTLEKIWCDVLKVPRVGIDANFFALGGHSLLIFQVLSRIRESLSIELPVKTVFEAPTIAKMAERIETMRWAVSKPDAIPSGEREEDEI